MIRNSCSFEITCDSDNGKCDTSAKFYKHQLFQNSPVFGSWSTNNPTPLIFDSSFFSNFSLWEALTLRGFNKPLI